MTSAKPSETAADIQALASEVVDLWQDHLAACAGDASARAELLHLIEPQRKLFADWVAMMQNGIHANSGAATGTSKTGTPGSPSHAGGAGAGMGASTGTAQTQSKAAAASSDDGALRLAQLAHRTSQLEKHLKDFERRIAALESGIEDALGRAKAPAKTGRDPKPRKSGVH